MGKIIDITGKVYGRLTVISYVSERRKGYWLCQCSCGNTKIIQTSKLKTGNTSSCGCFQKESRYEHRKTHGEAHKTKEWRTWNGMRRRCNSPDTEQDLKNYKGRGIIVCDRWAESYISFLDDVGRAPSPKHSLDRIDNNGNYEPGNVRWATKTEQANNTRKNKYISYQGQTKTLSEWSDALGFNYRRVNQRIIRGMSFEDAISKPIPNRYINQVH